MKKLLTKFRLSNALDEKAGGPVPNSLREKIDACPEARDFAQRAAMLDRGLRHPPAACDADATLHQSIMRAVRASAAESDSTGASAEFGTRGSQHNMRDARYAGCSPLPFGRAPMRIGLATAFAALAALGIWLAARPPARWLPDAASNAQSLAAAQIVVEVSGEISRSVPDAVVAPLSNELACVDHDIRDTTQFVLGVLP